MKHEVQQSLTRLISQFHDIAQIPQVVRLKPTSGHHKTKMNYMSITRPAERFIHLLSTENLQPKGNSWKALKSGCLGSSRTFSAFV